MQQWVTNTDFGEDGKNVCNYTGSGEPLEVSEQESVIKANSNGFSALLSTSFSVGQAFHLNILSGGFY